jgi:hypothetical protein
MGMEYSDGLMEKCITENGKRVNKMGTDITGGKMAINILENSRMTCYGEKEYSKTKKNCIETIMNKASA